MTPGWVELTGFEPVTPWLQTTFGRILANYSGVLQQLMELSTPWRTTRNVSVRSDKHAIKRRVVAAKGFSSAVLTGGCSTAVAPLEGPAHARSPRPRGGLGGAT